MSTGSTDDELLSHSAEGNLGSQILINHLLFLFFFNTKRQSFVCSLKGVAEDGGSLRLLPEETEIQELQQGELGEFHPCSSTANLSSPCSPPKIHFSASTELLGQQNHREQSELHQTHETSIGAGSQRIPVPGEGGEEFRASVLWQRGWSLF